MLSLSLSLSLSHPPSILPSIHHSIPPSLPESDEQRDSAVSCSSHENDGKLTDDFLSSFALPTPLIPSSSLENTQYPTVLAKLREVLTECQQKSSPQLSRATLQERDGVGGDDVPQPVVSDVAMKMMPTRTFSCSSQTSVDTTGSIDLERDHGDAATMANGVGKVGNGHVESHMTNGSDHMTNGGNHMTDDVDNIPNNVDGVKQRPSSVPDADAVFCNIPSSANGTNMVSGEIGRHSEDVPLSPQSPVPPNKKLLVRRMTCPSGMINQRNSLLTSSLGGVSPLTRRYGNASHQLAGRAMSITSTPGGGVSPLGSGRVKLRANPSATLSIKRRQRKSSIAAVSQSNLKLIKIVLAGNDILVSHAAKAYCYLRCEEPNLLNGLDVRFYHVPLSRASLIHTPNADSSSPGVQPTPDLPEPMSEQIDNSGNDVHIGRFLSNMDSWYERNVMLATHHLLRLVPSVS